MLIAITYFAGKCANRLSARPSLDSEEHHTSATHTLLVIARDGKVAAGMADLTPFRTPYLDEYNLKVPGIYPASFLRVISLHLRKTSPRRTSIRPVRQLISRTMHARARGTHIDPHPVSWSRGATIFRGTAVLTHTPHRVGTRGTTPGSRGPSIMVASKHLTYR